LSKNAKRARVGIQNRETSRLNRSKLFGVTRTIFLKVGLLLYKNNQIENPRDVFYLHRFELQSHDDLREIVKSRKEEEKKFLSIPSYTRLVFADKITNKDCMITNVQFSENQGSLSGTPTSVGIVQGEVLIIDNPTTTIDTSNKIIVTKSTDPGWVFLIQNATGIIAEKGSLLSHTAIVARELHKPAIVNVKDCTRLLKTGDIVELNAETGTIKILSRAR
jgi:pyruvate,water dikinase